MRLRTLGRSGLRVSELCLGAMTFGMPGWGCDEKTSLDLIARFVAAGGNFVDTADIYSDGRSEEICGKAIPYDVDWESLADDMDGLNFLDNISCHRLNMALRMICQDDLGKEAVRDGLKLVRLKNVKDKAAMRLTFEAGVLEMHCAYAQRTDGMFSDGEIRELLTKRL